MTEDFIKDETYVFTGPKINFYTENEPDANGHYDLGKFIEYRDIPLHGDIMPNGKAIFENGIIDCGQYHKVLSWKKKV